MRSLPETLAGERVILRALRPGVGAALAELVQRNRSRLADSFPSSVGALTDAESGEAYVAAKTQEWREAKGFWFGLHLAVDGALIGQVQLKNLDWTLGRGELAYHVDAAHEGRGLVREALSILIDAAFEQLGLRKVFLRALLGNARSAAIARRFGFTLEGTLRQEFRTFDGRIVDLAYFGLLSTEHAKGAAGRLEG